MKFDLKELAFYLTETGLMSKTFLDMNMAEIVQFCEQVHCATREMAGWCPPYINQKDELIIPYDAPPKYRYWQDGGQSIKDTLLEMNASDEIIQRYAPKEAGGLTIQQIAEKNKKEKHDDN